MRKKGIREVRWPKPCYQAGPSNGGAKKNFGVSGKTRFKKGHQSLGKSNSHRSEARRGGRPNPKKGNGGVVQRQRR